MKKTWKAIALAGLMSIGMVGCGPEPTSNTEAKTAGEPGVSGTEATKTAQTQGTKASQTQAPKETEGGLNGTVGDFEFSNNKLTR